MDYSPSPGARGGPRILYRVVEEYEEPGRPGSSCRPASSTRPLTPGQLIALIEGTDNPECDAPEGPLAGRFRDQGADDLESLAGFVRVESDFYPQLEEYFEHRAREWHERRRREYEDEEGEGDREDHDAA